MLWRGSGTEGGRNPQHMVLLLGKEWVIANRHRRWGRLPPPPTSAIHSLIIMFGKDWDRQAGQISNSGISSVAII